MKVQVTDLRDLALEVRVGAVQPPLMSVRAQVDLFNDPPHTRSTQAGDPALDDRLVQTARGPIRLSGRRLALLRVPNCVGQLLENFAQAVAFILLQIESPDDLCHRVLRFGQRWRP